MIERVVYFRTPSTILLISLVEIPRNSGFMIENINTVVCEGAEIEN